VEVAPESKVTVSWEICSKHKHMHHHGNCPWQARQKEESNDKREGYLSSDSEEMEIGEDVTCIGKCWTCKEDDKMRTEWGTEGTVIIINAY
jgi:hypothetical protein